MPSATSWRRPPLAASILAVSGIAVLCGLGTWQIQRLSEKEAMLQKITLWQAETPPPRLNALSFTANNLYKHGTLEGEWVADKSIRLIPRSYDGQPGAHLYTPLRLPDNIYVMVNRGWVPSDYKEETSLPKARIRVEGDILPFPRPNTFTPANKPGSQDRYRLSAEMMANETGGAVMPYIIRAHAAEPADPAALPNTSATAPQINNNHASYATFWFTMAGILAIIFFLRFIKPGRE